VHHARKRYHVLIAAVLAVAITGTTVTAAHAAPSASDIQKKIDKASDDLENIVESYNKMNDDLKKTKAAEKALAASLQPARDQLAVASAQVGTIANTAYKTGQVSAVNAVLDEPGTLMDRLGILEELSRTRQRQITNYTATTQQYEQKQAALRATQAKQTAEVKELTAHKKKIESDLKKLYAMRKAAFGSATESASTYSGSIPSVSGSAGVAVRFAFNAIGTPYVYGGASASGYDCSGLTQAAWAKAGKSLPHNAAAQWGQVTHISKAALAPGDLVFYRSLGHVAIYVGGGQIIDAPSAGRSVNKRSINIMTPYGYGRV
jgi:cell wall-associated NlpC family hydrolase